jgi:DHA2 family multidrug resistance protein-like MFS transporter
MVALADMPAVPGHLDVIWRIGLAAVGFGLFLSPNARQILAAAPMARVAAAGALSQTTRLAGQVLGSTAAAALLAAGVGAGSIPPLVAASLAGLTGLCSLGVGLTMARRPRHA